jgi:hypothetical protein
MNQGILFSMLEEIGPADCPVIGFGLLSGIPVVNNENQRM